MASYAGRDASRRLDASPVGMGPGTPMQTRLDVSPEGLATRTRAATRSGDGGSPGVGGTLMVEQPMQPLQHMNAASTVLNRLNPELQHLHEQIRAQEEALRHLQDWIEAESRERVRNVVDVTEGLRSVSDFLGLDGEGLTSAAEATRDREIHGRKARRQARRESRQRSARQEVFRAEREAAEVAALREGMESWEARTAQQLMVLDLELKAEVSRRYAADSQLAKRRGRAAKEEHGHASLDLSTQAPSSEASGTLLSGSIEQPRGEQDFMNECLKDLTMALVQERGDRELANEDLQAQLANCQRDIAAERQERVKEAAVLQQIAQGGADELRELRLSLQSLPPELEGQASAPSAGQRSYALRGEMAIQDASASPSYHLSPQALIFDGSSPARSSPVQDSAPRHELQAGLDGLEAWARRELESQALAHSAACNRLERRFDELQRHLSDEDRERSRESWQRVVEAAGGQLLPCGCAPSYMDPEDSRLSSPSRPPHENCWQGQLGSEVSRQAGRMDALEGELQGIRQGLDEEVKVRLKEDAEATARLKKDLQQMQDDFRRRCAEDADSLAKLDQRFQERSAEERAAAAQMQGCLRDLQEQMARKSRAMEEVTQVKACQDGVESLHAALDQERSDREAAHAELVTQLATVHADLSTEKDERIHTRAALPHIRQSLGEQLEERLRSIKWELDAEVQERTAALEAFEGRCADLHSQSAKELSTLRQKATGLQQEFQAYLSAALQKEQCEREIADSALKAQVASLRQDIASQKEERALGHASLQRSLQSLEEQTAEQIKALTELTKVRDVDKALESQVLKLATGLEMEQAQRKASEAKVMEQLQEVKLADKTAHRLIAVEESIKAFQEDRQSDKTAHRLLAVEQGLHSFREEKLSDSISDRVLALEEGHKTFKQEKLSDRAADRLVALETSLHSFLEERKSDTTADRVRALEEGHQTFKQEKLSDRAADRLLALETNLHSFLDERKSDTTAERVRALEEGHQTFRQEKLSDRAADRLLALETNLHSFLDERKSDTTAERVRALEEGHQTFKQEQLSDRAADRLLALETNLHSFLEERKSDTTAERVRALEMGHQTFRQEKLSDRAADRLLALEKSHHSFLEERKSDTTAERVRALEEGHQTFKQEKLTDRAADRLLALETNLHSFLEERQSDTTAERMRALEEGHQTFRQEKLSDRAADRLLTLETNLHSFLEERKSDTTAERLRALDESFRSFQNERLSDKTVERLLALEEHIRSIHEAKCSDTTAARLSALEKGFNSFLEERLPEKMSNRLLALEDGLQSVRESKLSDKTPERLLALQEGLQSFREERLCDKTGDRILALEEGLRTVREASLSDTTAARLLVLEKGLHSCQDAMLCEKMGDRLLVLEQAVQSVREANLSDKTADRLMVLQESLHAFREEKLSDKTADRLLALEESAKASDKATDRLIALEKSFHSFRDEKFSERIADNARHVDGPGSSNGKVKLSEKAAQQLLALQAQLQNEVLTDDSSEVGEPSNAEAFSEADSQISLAAGSREVESPRSDALISRRDLLQSTRQRLSSEVSRFSDTDTLERKLSGQVLKDVATVLEFLLCDQEESEARIQSLLRAVQKDFEASLQQVRLDGVAVQIKAEGEKRDALEQKVDNYLTASVCEAEVSKLSKRVEEFEQQAQALQSWLDQLHAALDQEIHSRRDHGEQLHTRLDEVLNKVELRGGVDVKAMTALTEQVASLSEAVISEEKERTSSISQLQMLVSQCSQSFEVKFEANRTLEKDCAAQLQTLSAAVDVSDAGFREKLATCQLDIEQEQLQRLQELKSLRSELQRLQSQTSEELEAIRSSLRSEIGQHSLTQQRLERHCNELGAAAEAQRDEDTKALGMLSDKMSTVSHALETSTNELSDRVSQWMESIETRLEQGRRVEKNCARQLQALSCVLEEEQGAKLDLDNILEKLEVERQQRIDSHAALHQSLQHLEVQAAQSTPSPLGSASGTSPGQGSSPTRGLVMEDSPGISNARWSAHTKAALEARLQDLAGVWRAELRCHHTELEASSFKTEEAEARLRSECTDLAAALSALQQRVADMESHAS